MYKAIVTYNFTDNDTRDSFVMLLESLGFTNHPDQSTYALKQRSSFSHLSIKDKIIAWSSTCRVRKDDSVQIYYASSYLDSDKKRYSTIDLYNLIYDSINRRLK